jgi:NAD+ diphosphatase
MIGFTARVDGVGPAVFRLQESEIADARWFTRDELRAAVADGSVTASGRLSISRKLVEHWLGHSLDAA